MKSKHRFSDKWSWQSFHIPGKTPFAQNPLTFFKKELVGKTLLLGFVLFLGSYGFFGCTEPQKEPPPTRTKTIVEVRYLPTPGSVRVDPKATGKEKDIYKTLQKAIEASNGRMIQVLPGEYLEPLVIPEGKQVLLAGDPNQSFRLKVPTDKPAITVSKGATLIIRHMTLEGGGRGIVVQEGASLHVEKCGFTKNLGQAIHSTKGRVSVSLSTFTYVQKPPDKDFKKYGIPKAIELVGGEYSIADSLFEETLDSGILVRDGATGSIRRCRFQKPSKLRYSAVAVQTGSSATLDDLKIKGWRTGIFISRASATIRNSTIEDSSSHGVLAGYGSWVHAEKNKVSRAKAGGIHFSISSGNIVDNDIIDIEEQAIFVHQGLAKGQILIEKNRVYRAKDTGIYALGGRFVIHENEVKDTKYDPLKNEGSGIKVRNATSAVISKNKVENSAGSGILLKGSLGTIDANEVKFNGEAGISVLNGLSLIKLSENKCIQNKVAGIFILESKVELSKNKVEGTIFSKTEQSGSGVVIFQNSEATIDQDTYYKNGQHGMLLLKGSKATVKGTTFLENKQYGAFLQCGSVKFTNTGNVFSKNGLGDQNKCP